MCLDVAEVEINNLQSTGSKHGLSKSSVYGTESRCKGPGAEACLVLGRWPGGLWVRAAEKGVEEPSNLCEHIW